MLSVLSAAVPTILTPTLLQQSGKFGVHAIGPASFRKLSSSQLNHSNIGEQSENCAALLHRRIFATRRGCERDGWKQWRAWRT